MAQNTNGSSLVADWQDTRKTRWVITALAGGYAKIQKQHEQIDFHSGETRWKFVPEVQIENAEWCSKKVVGDTWEFRRFCDY